MVCVRCMAMPCHSVGHTFLNSDMFVPSQEECTNKKRDETQREARVVWSGVVDGGVRLTRSRWVLWACGRFGSVFTRVEEAALMRACGCACVQAYMSGYVRVVCE